LQSAAATCFRTSVFRLKKRRISFPAPRSWHAHGSLAKIANDRELTQHAAAKLFGVTQPRVNLLLNGKIGEFSVDALVNMLGCADFTVEPRIVKTKTAA
jgi:hypothetical protein